MKLRHFFACSLISLSSLLGLSGCTHREFDYGDEEVDAAYINVVFDWANEPDAAPETMSLYLFPTDGRETIRHEFTGRDGGQIRVTAGTYHAICVNSDQRDVFFHNKESHSTFEITTSELSSLSLTSLMSVSSREMPRAAGTESQAIMSQPPVLWASSVTGIIIPAGASTGSRSSGDGFVLRMFPARIVDTYVVTVRNITGIENLQSLSATVSDLADGYLPASGSPNDNVATIALDMAHNVEAACAQGSFLTFGHCPSTQRSHRLMLYAILTDGAKYYYEFDVSEQAHQGPADDNIHYITVETLDLPELGASDGGGGVSPSVTDWQTIDIDISM